MSKSLRMSWYKVLIPSEDTERFMEIYAAACQRINQIPDFAVFGGSLFNDDDDTACQVIYFSPTAALECEALIKLSSGLKCDPPGPEIEVGCLCGDETVRFR